MSELSKLIFEKTGIKTELVEGSETELMIRVEPEQIVEKILALKNNGFSFLTMLSAKCRDDGFDVVYILDDWKHKKKIWVYSFVSKENPVIPSITPSWMAADYLEREVFDMFGIEFTNHPNLERILTPEGFTDFPLRKEFKETD